METQPNNDEVARVEAINLELCQKITDLEAAIERKNKALEGFMAENEALKAELGGKGKSARREETTTVKTNGAAHQNADKQDAIALLRRLGG